MKPRIAISMGDPTGIGPEVTLQALALRNLRSRCTPILVGDRGVFEETAGVLGRRQRFADWNPTAPLARGALALCTVSELEECERRPGHPTAAGGKAAYKAILEAMHLVTSGCAEALVTAPICKANLAAAGAVGPGHTELLARKTRSAPVRMMMAGPRFRVVLVTTHMAVRDVPAALTTRKIADTIAVTDRALREHFGCPRPRIGVAGLNPHAGEGGMFGDEEERVIAPAVRRAARRGIDVAGPLPADALIPQAAGGKFDAAVCMYHDQGLGPFKLIHFTDGVNVTLGLPFVRTSPDHGTAHDIAGRGLADAGSMAAALQLAIRLVRQPTTTRENT